MKIVYLSILLAASALVAKAQAVQPLYQNELKALKLNPLTADTNLNKLLLQQNYVKLAPGYLSSNMFDNLLDGTVFYSRMPVVPLAGGSIPLAVLKPTGDDKMVKRIKVIDMLKAVDSIMPAGQSVAGGQW